jgi:hypothetical protein
MVYPCLLCHGKTGCCVAVGNLGPGGSGMGCTKSPCRLLSGAGGPKTPASAPRDSVGAVHAQCAPFDMSDTGGSSNPKHRARVLFRAENFEAAILRVPEQKGNGRISKCYAPHSGLARCWHRFLDAKRPKQTPCQARARQWRHANTKGKKATPSSRLPLVP